MKYYNIEPVADAEIGEETVIDFKTRPRKIIYLQVYLFSNPESDLIQAYPAFLASCKLREAIEKSNLTGVTFLPCVTKKSEQYDELSNSVELPKMWGLEPIGKEGDDVIFQSETEIKISQRFLDVLARFSILGCAVYECKV